MGLSARQEKVLEHIEMELRASDPKLTALYTTFTRLAADEELPRIEELRHRVHYLLASLRRFFAAVIFAPLRHRRARRARSAVLFFPLALAVITTSITFAVRSTSPACATVRSVAAVSLGRTRLCTLTPAYAGR